MAVWHCNCGARLETSNIPQVEVLDLMRAGWRLSRKAWWVCGLCARYVELDDREQERQRKSMYQ